MEERAAGQDRVEIVVASRAAEIGRVAAALDDLAARAALPADAVVDMQVALDEILTNVVSYAYPDGGTGRIRVVIMAREDALEAEVTDDGAPFDPLSVAAPDHDPSLEHRGIGGVGIHFVRNLMTDVSYRRVGSDNVLTLRRLLRSAP
jgi:anti-sigma regulatory factor (Ser/Thr protein kinase)